jgi:acetyl esterase
MANSLSMVVVSVEYRLAPEHPYPTGQHDSLDAAIFALSPEGEIQLGGPLRILGGESAGGYLTVWVALALRDRHGVDVRVKIAALVPTYGLFDMSYTPSVLSHKRRALLGKEETTAFVEAEFGRIPLAKRKSPEVSPLFADLSGMPPALFIVGTEDPLLDDSVIMASRWSLAGNVAELRIFPGACHGFTLFPMGELTKDGNDTIIKFVSSKLL